MFWKLGRSLKIISLGRFINGFCRFPLYTILTLYYFEIFHLGYLDIGLIFTISGGFSILVSLYGGYISDKIGRKTIIIASCLIVIVSSALMFIISSAISLEIPFIAFSMLINLGSSLQRPALSSAITDLSDEEQRVAAFSINRITSNAGIGIGLVLAGVAWTLSPSLFFLITASGTTIELLLYLIFVPETYKRKENEMVAKHRFISNDKPLLTISLFLSFALLFSQQWLTSVFPLYMTRYDSLTVEEITVLYSINTVIVVVLQGSASKIISAIGELKAFSLGSLLFGVGYFLFGFLTLYIELIAVVILISFGENLTIIIPQIIVSKISPPHRRGEFFGTNSAISGMFFALSPLVGTSLLTIFIFDPRLTWIFLSVVSVAILAGIPLISRQITRKESSA